MKTAPYRAAVSQAESDGVGDCHCSFCLLSISMMTSSMIETGQETRDHVRTTEMLQQVMRAYRERGLAGLVAGAMNMVLGLSRRFVGRIVIVRDVYKIDLDKAKPPPEGTGLSLEEASLATLRDMYTAHKSEISPRRYQQLRQIVESASSACYLVRDRDGVYCDYYCLAFGREEHAGIFERISGVDIDSNGYLFRTYTFKEHRRKGIHAFAKFSLLAILKEKGYRTATSRIARGNVSALGIESRVGFERRLVELHFHFFDRFPNSKFLVFPVRDRGTSCH